MNKELYTIRSADSETKIVCWSKDEGNHLTDLSDTKRKMIACFSKEEADSFLDEMQNEHLYKAPLVGTLNSGVKNQAEPMKDYEETKRVVAHLTSLRDPEGITVVLASDPNLKPFDISKLDEHGMVKVHSISNGKYEKTYHVMPVNEQAEIKKQ